jgi:hypothetical protein
MKMSPPLMAGGVLAAGGLVGAAYVKKNEDDMDCVETKLAAAAGMAVIGMAMIAAASGMTVSTEKIPTASMSSVAKAMSALSAFAVLVLAMEKHSGQDRVDAEKEAMLFTATHIAFASALVALSFQGATVNEV